jgi:ligand-binding sensor domain-containing protein
MTRYGDIWARLRRQLSRGRRPGLVSAGLSSIVLVVLTCAGIRAHLASDHLARSAVPPNELPTPRLTLNGDQDFSFRRLTLQDGLSQSTINCIAQDGQGFIWFGTDDGLNRYDGYTFKVYRHVPDDPFSLADNAIKRCQRDQRGVVWAVTQDGTLHRAVPGTDQFIRYNLALEDPFRQMGSEITGLHGDAQGRLWIATSGDGLVRYDPDADAFTYYRSDAADPSSLGHRMVHRVYEDREGTIWVGTEGGLNRYDPVTDGFVRYPYRDFPAGGYQYDPPVHTDDPAFQPDNPSALASPAVTAILEDRAGRLWIGTRYGGLNRLDRETSEFTAYPFDPADTPTDPNTFSGNSVRGLVADRQGRLWVSSAHWNLDRTRTFARLGLERLAPDTGTITRYAADPADPCALPHDATLLMVEDVRGTLWFHTFGGGAEIYDDATGCFKHYGHDRVDAHTLSGDDISVFYEDEAGGLWIGTGAGGISHYDPAWSKFRTYRIDTAGVERFSNTSICRMQASPGSVEGTGQVHGVWVSTFAGLNYWDRRTQTSTFYEIDPALPDTIAYGIFEDPRRRVLWLGTPLGLERGDLPVRLDAAPKTLSFTRVLTRSGSSVGLVLALYPAAEEQLWVAQYQLGLSRFDLATETVVETYRHDPAAPTGLADDRITGLFPAIEGALWLVTPAGLDHFDPATEIVTHYLHNPKDPQSVPARVLAIHQTGEDGVWLGADGEGLQYLDLASGEVTAVYREEQGLPNNVVYAILPDTSGHLWLSTNRGLARFDPETEVVVSYTALDGLQGNEFYLSAALRAPDGELFFVWGDLSAEEMVLRFWVGFTLGGHVGHGET